MVAHGGGSGDETDSSARGGGILWRVAPVLIVLGITAGFCGLRSGGDGDARSPEVRIEMFAKGDCGGPDPGLTGVYRQFGCDEPGATFTALDVISVQLAVIRGAECPSGTDEVIALRTDFVLLSPRGESGSPDGIICARNLAGSHPGDPGAGGGQVVQGDCLAATGMETPCSSGGQDSVKVLDLVKRPEDCPDATTTMVPLPAEFGGAYRLVCGDDG